MTARTASQIAGDVMHEARQSPSFPVFTSREETIIHGLITKGVAAALSDLPSGNWRPNFEPDERVEQVIRGAGRGPQALRPGVVVAIDDEPRMHHYLRVKFDDGEERQINPDVMRRIREPKE